VNTGLQIPRHYGTFRGASQPTIQTQRDHSTSTPEGEFAVSYGRFRKLVNFEPLMMQAAGVRFEKTLPYQCFSLV